MKLFERMFPPVATSSTDFAPPLQRLQAVSPNPLGRMVLWALLILLGALLIWTVVGRLDIVAIAEGKLVPESYLKIVQPAEGGIVTEILVREGESVRAGQVLMRLDALVSDADANTIEADFQRKRLMLRRIEAELSGKPFVPEAEDPPMLADEVAAQYRANRSALEATLAEERSWLIKARQELAVAEQVRKKIEESLPHYRAQERAFAKLAKDGFAGPLLASDKRREYLEKEQELQTQLFVIESARAGMLQSEKKLVQLESDYRRQLHAERSSVQGDFERLTQEMKKQTFKQGLHELRASQDGVVKDIATHTVGAVVQPGTVLVSLVPKDENLRAEVWIGNEDIGFVRKGQQVKLKFAAFPFQKYGMVDGVVDYVSADSGTGDANDNPQNDRSANSHGLVYRASVILKRMSLELDGERFPLAAGMQTNAEIWLGDRTVVEYLLSPVRKAWHEAGRER